MKRRSAGVIIARTFLRSIGIMLIFFAAGVLSYYLTMLYYNQTDRVERSTQYTHVISVNTGNESSNLIYSYDQKKKKVDAVVLELFDQTTKNLNYITIPANTQITIDQSTYSEILKVNQGVPQVIRLADIPQYFSGDVAYEYGIMILADELSADIGYFTMLDTDVFHKYFRKLNRSALTYYPSELLLSGAAECKSSGDMDDFIEDKWDSLVSDITLNQKQHYSDALVQVNQEYIRGYSAYGSKSSGTFILNKKKNKKLINTIWESDAYTSAQQGLGLGKDSSDSSGDSSKKKDQSKKVSLEGRSIQVTNATGIDGLAAAYKEKLAADGYEVSGVGNYVGNAQTTTTIYAKKRKWAKALAGYFKNPDIQKADNLTNGADIEIVLGTKDAIR